MPGDRTTQERLEISERIDRLRHQQGEPFPAEAVAEAREHREELVPELIKCLEANVELGEYDESAPSLIALCLLIEFNARQAWPVVQRLMLLPGGQPLEILGDGIHEIVPTAVALWGADDLERLSQWCLDTNINVYCRSAVAGGVVEAYGRGLISRQRVLGLHKELLERADPEDDEFRTFLINNLLDIHGDELREEIEDAFDRDLVDPIIVSKQDVEAQFQGDKETQLEQFRGSLVPLHGFTDQLRHWASFEPRTEPEKNRPAVPTLPRPRPTPLPEPPTSGPPKLLKARRQVGRNDPCPCGSGKKFKKCCLNK